MPWTIEDQFPQQEEDPASAALRQRMVAESLRMADSPQQKVEMPAAFTQEQIREMYGQMQKKQTFGNILQASGDRALSPLGKSLSANDPTKFLTDQARQEQVRRYQEYQGNMGGDKKLQYLTKAYEAMKGGKEDKAKMPKDWGEALLFDSQQLRGLVGSRETLKDSYAEPFGKAVGSAGYTGGIEGFGRWLTQNANALTTPEQREAAQWWANLEAEIIAPWRNALFGATLTHNEQRAFSDLANMSPGMPKDEIDKRLNNLAVARREGARKRAMMTIDNYGTGHLGTINRTFDDLLEGDDKLSYDDGSAGGGGPALPPDYFDKNPADVPAPKNPNGSGRNVVRGRKHGDIEVEVIDED